MEKRMKKPIKKSNQRRRCQATAYSLFKCALSKREKSQDMLKNAKTSEELTHACVMRGLAEGIIYCLRAEGNIVDGNIDEGWTFKGQERKYDGRSEHRKVQNHRENVERQKGA